jgi:hypothetical protein
VFGLVVLGIFALILLWAFLLDRRAKKHGHTLRPGRKIRRDMRDIHRAAWRGQWGGPRYGNDGLHDSEKARWRDD